MSYIIAFEGIDGTGKGTQMTLAAKRLRSAGKTVSELSFPMYDTFFGSEVGKLLTAKEGVRADSVNGKSMALWFALDRFEALRGFDPEAAQIVLINRYVLSNAVYQSIRDCDANQPDILDFILSMEHEHFGIPVPDAYFLFDMDLEQAKRNVSKKGFRDYVGSEQADIYEAVPDIQRRARTRYLEYASRFDNVHVIQCMKDGALLPIEEIASLVDSELKHCGIL